MKPFPVCLALGMIITTSSHAQKKNNDIVGVWKGTSLCQVKPSPCNDETVVYHITRGKTDSTYTVQANKIVNGVEEEMGTLDLIYDKEKKILRGTTSRNGRTGDWFFRLDGQKMHGTLTTENTLYRVIEVEKKDFVEGGSAFINNSNQVVIGHK